MSNQKNARIATLEAEVTTLKSVYEVACNAVRYVERERDEASAQLAFAKKTIALLEL